VRPSKRDVAIARHLSDCSLLSAGRPAAPLERVQRLQFAVNRSTRNFCEIRVQKKRVRLTTVTASWTNELHLTAHGLSDSRQFFDAPAAVNQHNLPASQHQGLRLRPLAGAFIFSPPDPGQSHMAARPVACGLMVRDATQGAWLLTMRVQTRAKSDGLIPRRRVSAVSRDSRIRRAICVPCLQTPGRPDAFLPASPSQGCGERTLVR
jgi:hypothetical protein